MSDDLAPPLPARQQRRIAPTWIGLLLAVGGALAVVSGFLEYAKISYTIGTYSFTGLGVETVSGAGNAEIFTPGNPGKTILAIGVVAAVLGLLVVARQGRLWTGVVAIVAGVIGTLLGVVALVEPARDADSFSRQIRTIGAAAPRIQVTGSIGIGAILGIAGAVIALVAGLLVVTRRGQTATTESTVPPAEPNAGAELAS